MKNLKKLLAVLVVISMISTFFVPTFAAEFTYETEAEDLYELGLYKGTSTTVYEPNLGGKLDRQTGVVMLLRLFGQEEEALEVTAEDAAAKLAAKFTDAASIADWAQRQVAYAVEKGYVKGLPDGTFAPAADLNGKAYCSLILQQLGYDGDFTYDTAAFDLSEKGGLLEAQAQIFNSNAGINRDSMVGISYSALQGVYKESGKTVIEALVENENIDKEKAIEVGVLKKEIKAVAELEDVKVQIGGTAVLPTEVEVTYVDDTTETLAITWPTVDTSAVGEQTIEGAFDGYTDTKATVKVIVQPAELLVDGVEMNNLIEIVVNFNGETEAGLADEAENYSVDDYTIDSVSLSEDKTSATLLLTKAADQEEELEVTIKTGAGLKTEVTETVTALDNTLPEAESIELTGPNSFEVKFSEPVNDTEGDGDVVVDGGTYYVSAADLSDDGRSLSIELGVSSLSEGTYDVKVKGYRDAADFTMMPKTFEVEYAKDTEASTATIKSASQNKVEIEFNEPVVIDVDEADLVEFFYHTYSSWKPETVEVSDNDRVYTLNFEDYLLPEGSVTVTVVHEWDDVVIEDKWGNELESDIKLDATVVADDEAPAVSKVEATAEDEIEITFTEDVDPEQAEDEDNYVIKQGGDEVDASISDISYNADDNMATITLSDKLAGGTYTIDIEGICDTSVSENEMEAITLEFEVSDKTAPEIEEVTFVGDSVYVTYSEPMATSGDGSVLDEDNYQLKKDSTEAEIEKIEMFGSDKDKVKITVDEDVTLDTGYALRVVRVEDVAGNAIDPFVNATENLAVEDSPEVTEVKITAETDIEIVINKVLDRSTVDKADFEVRRTGVDAVALTKINSITFDDGETIIKGKLASSVQPANAGDITGQGYVLAIVDEVESDTGEVMAEADSGVDFDDAWAPSLVEEDAITQVADANAFTIDFDEDVVDHDLAATDLVIVDEDGDTLVAGDDFTFAVDAGNITITLAAGYITDKEYAEGDEIEFTVSTKDTVNYIKDAAGNAVETFEDEEVTITIPTEPEEVAFSDLAQVDGVDGTTDTTELTVTLDEDVNLVEADITLTGATLDGVTDNNDGTYTLAISAITVANGETVTVALSKDGYTFTPASDTVVVYEDGM